MASKRSRLLKDRFTWLLVLSFLLTLLSGFASQTIVRQCSNLNRQEGERGTTTSSLVTSIQVSAVGLPSSYPTLDGLVICNFLRA